MVGEILGMSGKYVEVVQCLYVCMFVCAEVHKFNYIKIKGILICLSSIIEFMADATSLALVISSDKRICIFCTKSRLN